MGKKHIFCSIQLTFPEFGRGISTSSALGLLQVIRASAAASAKTVRLGVSFTKTVSTLGLYIKQRIGKKVNGCKNS